MNLEKIRKDFPLLASEIGGKPIVYFDNACQSLRPQSVIDAVEEYYREYPVCAGRSAHSLGRKVTTKYKEARQIIANFIGAKKTEEIVFTRNTTESINLVANSLELKSGDVVLITDKEHNSNLVPWQIRAQKDGIVLRTNESKSDGKFDLEKFKENMSDKVKLVAMVLTSNLDGMTIPVKEIIEIAHSFGAKVLLDGAQAVAHQKINVAKLGVDFLAFSGHKMLGPSGTGVLYGKYDLLKKLKPFIVGGDTVEYTTYTEHKLLPPPEKFEAGLQNYAGFIGLAEAVKYLKKIGLKKIAKREKKLNKIVSDGIGDIEGLRIIGSQNPDSRGGVTSFYVEGKDCHQIALILDSGSNIMVRSGQFCVHSWFNDKQIKGAVRVSLAFYNTEEEARFFVEKLKEVIKIM